MRQWWQVVTWNNGVGGGLGTTVGNDSDDDGWFRSTVEMKRITFSQEEI